MAKRPPYRPPPPPYRPQPAAPPPRRGPPGPGMEQVYGLHQTLVITPRIRATVDDGAVEAATMLPTDD